MSAIELVPAAVEHIAPIARRMRAADRAEIWATAHVTPEEALVRGFELGTQLVVGIADGELLGMAGVTPMALLGDVGVPWMLCTDEIRRHRRGVVESCRPWIHEAAQRWQLLVNYVDERNRTTQRWLRGLGFTLAEPEPYGADGLPFRRFQMGQGYV